VVKSVGGARGYAGYVRWAGMVSREN